MSRIGKRPVPVTGGAKVTVSGSQVTVEGPKGKALYTCAPGFIVAVKDGLVSVSRPADTKQSKATHGLIRSLIQNMIIGVTAGYQKNLEVVGVGFKAAMQGKILNLQLSYSHPINYTVPEGVTVETPKPNIITVKGIDKAKVGEVAAEIRDFYRPEPYKGKGIKYAGEHVRRKAGKAVAGAAGGK